MSSGGGGPHGDKWNSYDITNFNSVEILNVLNTEIDGFYPSAAFVIGNTLYVAYYGRKQNED